MRKRPYEAEVDPRPRIGVTGPDHGGTVAWWFTALAVRRAGGRPIRIRPGRPRSAATLHGLILGGGADVGDLDSHDLSRVARRLTTWRRWVGGFIWYLRFLLRRRKKLDVDRARDALETELLREALQCSLPILGICRGAQLVNLAFEGSLHAWLEGFYVERPNPRSVFPAKTVLVEPESRLGSIIGPQPCRVNALHSHAVDAAGRGLRPVGFERNGVVQAIESADDRWILGVQWHPEFLPQHERHQRLFRALVGAAGGVPPS
jgi:putative glutamine amidotransferase